jgi:hypothetical protein
LNQINPPKGNIMTATITWVIEWMNTTPTTATPPETVITAGWRCNGVQVEGSGDTAKTYNATVYSTCSFPAPDIPYADLTQEMVVGWVQTSLGKDTVEASLQSQIDAQINPVQESGMPWVTP